MQLLDGMLHSVKIFKYVVELDKMASCLHFLFNVCVHNLIQEISTDGFGCHISQTFFGFIMYADDILLLSPSIHGLQCMLDRCNVYGRKCDILFNPKNLYVLLAIGFKVDRKIDSKMNIGDNEIQWVSELKYLGVNF
jgi:hypothetical protein